MNHYVVYDIWREIMEKGRESSPRGQKVKELDCFQGYIDNPWSTYKSRNYPLSYAKREFQWYLNSDPFDDRICKHAKTWSKIQQDTGEIFSNYGYYWFNPEYIHGMSGIEWVIETLKQDPDSRQAYIPMNNVNHIFMGNKDVVCSKGPQFRIINGALHIQVSFRSSDAVYGLGTDLPTYWWLWEMVALGLNIPRGMMVFEANSLHIYEKHWGMVNRVIQDGYSFFEPVSYPEISDNEDLLSGRLESEFGKWLMEDPL